MLLIGPLGTNFSDILIQIHTFSLKKIHFKMSSGKWRPFFSASMPSVWPCGNLSQWNVRPFVGETTGHQWILVIKTCSTASNINNGVIPTGLKLENYYFFTFTFSRPEVRKLLLFYVFTFSRPEVRKLLLFYVFTFSRPEVRKLLLFYVFTFSRPARLQ